MLIGLVGKFWHRHRKPRPVEYNPDPEYHKRRDDAKMPIRRRVARAQGAAATAISADVSAPPTPAKNGDVNNLSRHSPSSMKDDDDRAISPVSTASSASEPPLAQKVKLNGVVRAKSGTPRSSGAAVARETKGPVKPIAPREKTEASSVKEDKKPVISRVKSENGGHEKSPVATVHASNLTADVLPPAATVVSERFL